MFRVPGCRLRTYRSCFYVIRIFPRHSGISEKSAMSRLCGGSTICTGKELMAGRGIRSRPGCLAERKRNRLLLKHQRKKQSALRHLLGIVLYFNGRTDHSYHDSFCNLHPRGPQGRRSSHLALVPKPRFYLRQQDPLLICREKI
jgi:hypothetical protein